MAGIAEFAARLRLRLGPRLKEVRVFGSRARGDAGPGSDLDLFVLLDHNDQLTRREICGMADDIMLEQDCVLCPSPLVMDEQEFQGLVALERRLAHDIIEQGILL